MMLVLNELTRYYGSFLALDHLSMTISDGELHGFVGPNGRGQDHDHAHFGHPAQAHRRHGGFGRRGRGGKAPRDSSPDGLYAGLFRRLRPAEKLGVTLGFLCALLRLWLQGAHAYDRQPSGAGQPSGQARELCGRPLPRHEATPVPGPRAHPRPPPSDPRRAGLRHGPPGPGPR